MKAVRFEFDSSLQLLLQRNLRDQPIEVRFRGPQSVKHLIESLGIPHTEIGLVNVNGQSTGLEYIVHNGDRIEVQPVAPAIEAEETRFVLDGHLGRLASHLRMLGLDCLYHNGYEDKELVRISVEEERVLLTRDRMLLMHKVIARGYLLRSLDSTEQLQEVVRRYGLMQWVKPFQRCMRCNHPLEVVSKETVLEKLEPLTRKYYDEFKLCPACDQVYWKGSHYERMLQLIENLLENDASKGVQTSAR
jgi:uncharacterized protein with PIN domain/sulfur carrier protein ThiS